MKRAFLGLVFLTTISGEVTAGDLSPFLHQRLSAMGKDEKITVIVRMKKRADLTVARTRTQAFASLRKASEDGRRLLKPLLRQKKVAGKLSVKKAFWLANSYLVQATPEALEALAKSPEIESIHENIILSLPPVQTSAVSPSGSVEWGLSRIKADTIWNALGIKGNNVRIGHLDTGVDGSHPDLVGKIALWAEFDGNGSRVSGSTAHDSGTHGTHTAGTLVGSSAGGSAIGVAPEAKLLSAMVLTGASGTFAQVVSGMEWVADPDGNPDTDDGAHVLSMSLGTAGAEPLFVEPVQNLIAAGVFPAFSIGNSGVGTTTSPGNVPSSFGVGASDASDQIASFSCGGTVSWNKAPFVGDYLKPDISAPGVGIKSAFPGGGYQSLQGTSMAAPHVAGAVALMLSANPTLTIEEIKTSLKNTARDRGTPGPDNRYGWGILDAYAAVSAVNVMGSVKGTITDGAAGVAATVRVPEKNLTVQANAQGVYQLSLSEGSYTLEVSAFGYQTKTQAVTVAKGQDTTANFTLEALDSGFLTGTITHSATGSGLAAQIEILGTDLAPIVSDSQGHWSVSLPVGTYDVRVTKSGFRTVRRNAVTVAKGQTTSWNLSLDPLASLLLVDDDGGQTWVNVESYYTQSLDRMNRSYSIWNVASQGSPSLDDLSGYPVVIWFTGNTWNKTLTTQDQQVLTSYLEQGGRLLLSGQDIGYELASNSFMRTVLGGRFIQDDANTATVEGTGLLGGFSFSIAGSEGANNQHYPSEMDVVKPAVAIAYYKADSGSTSSGLAAASLSPVKSQSVVPAALSTAVAAVAMERLNYHSIYCAFGLEAISLAAKREEFLSKALDWLDNEILPKPSEATASWKAPWANQKLSGDTISLLAEGNAATQQVTFQYRLQGNTEWSSIGTDTKSPFGFSWDVSALPQGSYELRLVPSDQENLSNTTLDPITVAIVSAETADVVEKKINGLLEKTARLAPGQRHEVALSDGTKAVIPVGVLSQEASLVMAQLDPRSVPGSEVSNDVSLKPIDVFRKLEFTNGYHQFPANVVVTLPYHDDNSDGLVDGTNYPVSSLRLVYRDEAAGRWVELSTNQTFSAQASGQTSGLLSAPVNHFTTFGIMALVPSAAVDQVIVYPNPFRPSQGTITFDNLPVGTKISVYTITGREVQTLEVPLGGQRSWDVRNSDGEQVASGVYLYQITANGEKTLGKLAVIR